MKAVVARRALQILSIATIATVGGCNAPPRVPDHDIVPLLEMDKRWAGPGSPVELTYRFDVAEDDVAIERDYEVAVDFVGAGHDVIFSDHHMPPTPTSSWAAGTIIEYRRTVFVPRDAVAGPATVELALRAPETEQQISLAGGEGGTASLVSEVGQLTVDSRATGVPVTYKDGWYGIEANADAPAVQWQWSAGSALNSFPNPRTDAVIYLHAHANVEVNGEPAEVSVRVGPGPGHFEVARFRVEQPGPFLERIYVPAKLMGSMDQVELLITTDKVVVPAEAGTSSDPRRLGLRVFNLYVEPQPNWTSYQLEPMGPIAPEGPPEPYPEGYTFTEDWFSGNIPVWKKVLAPFKGKPDIHYLEVGVFEGRSYIWMADNIFTHPTSTLTGVDLFAAFEDVSGDTVKATFLENVRRAGISNRSALYAGYSQLELRKLPFNSYDVIYIDGGHDAATVLEDAMLCRRLLKAGGIIIFDDYDWPPDPGVRIAVDLIVQIYGEEFSIVHRGYQLILRKGERS